jgi:hypothetical protein
LTIAAALAVLLSIPVLVPYLRTQQTEGFGRTLAEAGRHAAALQSYTQVPPVNLLYGATGVLAPRAPRPGAPDRTHVEHQMFPGMVLVLLAAFGFGRHLRSDAQPVAWTAAILVGTGALLSFGPDGWGWLYAMLHDNLFGFHAFRAPARFAVIAVSGLALLAALGMRTLIEIRLRHMAGVLLALLCLEYVNAPLPLVAAPPRRTDVGQWLAVEPRDGAVLHLPIGVDIENTRHMVQSLEHWRPLVNGYSGQRPAFFASLVETLMDIPSPTSFSLLRELDVRFVVSASPLAGAGHQRSPLVERARLPGGVIYELRWSPEAVAALDDVNAPPPPPPGPPPFTTGEVAVYEIYWDGGPLDVPAGSATMTVINGHAGGQRWEFETEAETADWVSTFFRANDRFTTITDGDLLPIEHRREIRQGRRQLERRYRYDRTSNLLQTDQMALPLGGPAARDAFSALYYVRTLALAPGAIVSVPLNEAGAFMLLQVSVAEFEAIEHRGNRVRALRLEPRVVRRLEPGRPVAITIWLSADERRIPLRALVDAGFGRIRLELKEHRR